MPEEDTDHPGLRPDWAQMEPDREQLTQDPCTDLGNSERVARHFADELLYVPEAGYYRWKETHWEPCSAESVHNLVGRLFRNHRQTLRRIDPEDDGHFQGWLRESEGRARLVAAENLLRGNHSILTDMGTFDSQPYLLNFLNGTLDVRDGMLRQHDPSDRIARVLAYNYDPGGQSDLFEGFISTITGGDAELADFLQLAFGYTICGLPSEEVLFFLYGTGANGKTTLVEAVKAAMGCYAQKAPPTLLRKSRSDGASPDRARLQGTRMAICSELDESTPLGESEIKDIVSRDTIAARALYKDFFEFHATHVLWIMGNHRPRVSGTDDGIWRRIMLVPFTVTIPEHERDRSLLEQLKCSHIPAIMNWMVEGARLYLENGIEPPQAVIQATLQYRHEMDVVRRFLADCCVCEPNAEIPLSMLYDCYRRWVEIGGEMPLSKTRFGRRLEELDYQQRRTARLRLWVGIRIDPGSPENPYQPPVIEYARQNDGDDGDD